MLSNLDLRSTLHTNELCFVKFSCIWPNFTFPGRWGKIKIKVQLSPAEAETGAELGKKKLESNKIHYLLVKSTHLRVERK